MQILYPTDGSPGALSALDLIVTSLAPDRVEHVEVVSVAPPPPAWRSVRPTRDPLGELPWEAGHRLAAEAAVQQAIDRLQAGGFAASGTIRVGHAAEQIVMLASEAGAHLIVLGSREHSGPNRLLVGGVSAKVARYAVSPVLIVHGLPRIPASPAALGRGFGLRCRRTRSRSFELVDLFRRALRGGRSRRDRRRDRRTR